MQFGNDAAKALEVTCKEKELCRELVSNDAVEAGCRLGGVGENLWDGLKGSIIKLLESEYFLTHLPEDIFEIPQLISSIRDDYKFYMRFNGMGLWPCDYVLFAV